MTRIELLVLLQGSVMIVCDNLLLFVPKVEISSIFCLKSTGISLFFTPGRLPMAGELAL